jgi:hypothetical protein
VAAGSSFGTNPGVTAEGLIGSRDVLAFVPEQEPVRLAADYRFGRIACTNSASTRTLT